MSAALSGTVVVGDDVQADEGTGSPDSRGGRRRRSRSRSRSPRRRHHRDDRDRDRDSHRHRRRRRHRSESPGREPRDRKRARTDPKGEGEGEGKPPAAEAEKEAEKGADELTALEQKRAELERALKGSSGGEDKAARRDRSPRTRSRSRSRSRPRSDSRRRRRSRSRSRSRSPSSRRRRRSPRSRSRSPPRNRRPRSRTPPPRRDSAQPRSRSRERRAPPPRRDSRFRDDSRDRRPHDDRDRDRDGGRDKDRPRDGRRDGGRRDDDRRRRDDDRAAPSTRPPAAEPDDDGDIGDMLMEEEEDEDAIIERQRQARLALAAKLKKSAKPAAAPTPSAQSAVAPTAAAKVQAPAATPTAATATTAAPKPDGNGAAAAEPVPAAIEEEDDMFSSDFKAKAVEMSVGGANTSRNTAHIQDNFTDSEGYYRVKVGEMLDGRYSVFGATGQGVFSNVVRVRDMESNKRPAAIKIIRNNELMYKAGLVELDLLRKVKDRDPNGKYHCIQFLRHFVHRQHLCLVFESMSMNLREVVKKYGKAEGLNLKAVQQYASQLMLSLKLLRKCEVLHADIKPDNILVNDAKSVVKLCDFGSACKDGGNDITPYLCSRFYRAPEIMIGRKYSYPLDMWSMACTLYELYTGRILFQGDSNNEMLKLIFDVKGKPSKHFIKGGQFREKHFNADLKFLYQEVDSVTKLAKVSELTMVRPTADLGAMLLGDAKLVGQQKHQLGLFRDLLEKMLMVDPTKRATPKEALAHPFFKEKIEI